MRKIATAALPVLLLSACAGLSDLASSALKRPTLTFRAASLQALDLEGATVGLTWDLENPNGFGVELARAGWTAEVEGTRVASGDLPGGLQVRANGKAPVSFPVRVRFQDVPGIVSLLGSGKDSVRYKVGGTLGVQTPFGILDLPLGHEGRLKLPAIPRFALEGVAVRSIGMDAVTVDVRLRLKNPNGFPLPGGKLDYDVAIAGAPLARASSAAIEPVAGASSAVVSIPVRVDFASAGRAAAALARGGDVGVKLSGSASLGGIAFPLDLEGIVPAR